MAGAREDDFEEAFRGGWMPMLAKGSEARLLWFLRQAHGSGPSYTFVTVTGVSDGGAWEALARRLASGDMRSWVAELDAMRHDSKGKILVTVPWSPLRDVDLGSVPTSGERHELSLYMEDTAWPYAGGLGAYLEAAGSLYDQTLARSKESGTSIIEMEAAFQPLLGTHRVNEVVLWQKVVQDRALLHLLTHDTPPEQKGQGTWMHDALKVRDRWESRLLRTSSWSPLY